MGTPTGKTRPPRGSIRVALAVVVAIGLGACQATPPATPQGFAGPPATPGGSEAASQPTPAGSTDEATSGPAFDSARSVIDGADTTDPDSISAIGAIRFTEEGAAAAAQAIRSGATGDTLWAATWVYGAAGTDADVLLPLLSSTDPTIRALAAAPLLAWGRREAAEELVKLLGIDGDVRGSDPPLRVSDFAGGTLARFVTGPTIATDASPADRATAWSAWLAANGATMQFDPTTATWSAP